MLLPIYAIIKKHRKLETAKGLGLEILDVFIKGFLIRRADGIHRQDWASTDAPRRLRGDSFFGAQSWGNSADLSGWWYTYPSETYEFVSWG